jgi:hypothetical protein
MDWWDNEAPKALRVNPYLVAKVRRFTEARDEDGRPLRFSRTDPLVADLRRLIDAVSAQIVATEYVVNMTVAAMGCNVLTDEKFAGFFYREHVEDMWWLTQRIRLRKMLPDDDDAPQSGACDPRDGDGWEDAVGLQGIRIPHGDDFYHSTHWELINAWLKIGRCSECRTTSRRTRLHHENPDSFGRERREDLTELCDRCHAKRHGAGVWKKAA